MQQDEIIIRLNDKEFNVHYTCDSLCEILINGKPYKVELLKKFKDNVFSFVVNQKLMQVELDITSENTISINYNGMIYDIDITDSTRQMLEKFIKSSDSAGSQGVTTVKAPMPGMIIKIYVEPGMMVMAGDKLLIVEAMKMENVLKSPVSGKVSKVIAQISSAVDKNAPLIEIESV